jgi:proline iminopeptidase
MKQFLTAVLFLVTNITFGQTLYSRSFGNSKNEPVIFLHGGPSNSSVYFEATTAQKLADKGFYVIIYDRRGDGRSVDKNAKMNFEEAFTDLNSIYAKYGLKRANLIGFSFGGLVTTLFTEKYPDKVKSVVFVSALVSQQKSYDTMLRTTKQIYETKHDSANLKDIAWTEKLDKNSIEYRTAVFKHASQNGYFKVAQPNELAKGIYAGYDKDLLISKYVKNEQAVPTFWKNEKRVNIDVTPVLEKLRSKKIDIYALYGKQDGIFSVEQINEVRNITGENRLKYLDNCSHTLFIDQQAAFLSAVTQWLK